MKNKMKKQWSDYGESSLTLLAVHCGLDKASPSIPYDPSDFKRCVHLIQCLGLNLKQERKLLEDVAYKYAIWKPFVKKWGKLMSLYNEEKDDDSASKLYKLLLKIRKSGV